MQRGSDVHWSVDFIIARIFGVIHGADSLFFVQFQLVSLRIATFTLANDSRHAAR